MPGNFIASQTVVPFTLSSPKKVNWKDLMPPVRNQEECDCCWAIVAADIITSHLKKYKEKKIRNSPQYLIDYYDPKKKGEKCFTLSINKAFKFIVKNGICREDDYPFLAKRINPPPKLKVRPYMPIVGFKKIPDNDNSQRELLMEVKKHPVGAAMLVCEEFKKWKGGKIYSGPSNFPTKIKGVHAIQIIVYGRDKKRKKDFWYVMSSWGKKWGNGGIAKVDLGVLINSTYHGGFSPLVFRASYPILAD